jgi:hypothetical protein
VGGALGAAARIQMGSSDLVKDIHGIQEVGETWEQWRASLSSLSRHGSRANVTISLPQIMVRAMLRSAIPRVARRAPVAHCTCFHTLPSLRAQTLASPVSVSPSSTPLRQVFDSPSFVTSNPTSTVPTGLFLQPLLTTPDAFLDVAEQTILRAQVLVTRICAPSEISDSLPGVESQFLAMVKNLDRLSDLLCGVIDLAELVRNVHPDEAWNEGANEAYESLCAYMNVLNTHVGLYQVSFSILPPRLPRLTDLPGSQITAFDTPTVNTDKIAGTVRSLRRCRPLPPRL